jgi:hypothetical protein
MTYGNSHYDPRNQGQYPAPKPPLPPKKNLPWWAWVLIVFVGIPTTLIGAAAGLAGGSGLAEQAGADKAPVISTVQPTAPVDTYDPGIQTPPTKPAVPSPKVTHKPAPALTKSQEQAIGAARDYLATSAFSRKGLIQQLSSAYGEGFSAKDATFAVDHLNVDWSEQAARSAKSYLEVSHFSRSGLIHQLESAYGEQFTHAQAVYGVTAAGL